MVATREPARLKTDRVENVEFLRVGIGNGRNYTKQDMAHIVEADEALYAYGFRPTMKLGHNPQQPLLVQDGLPHAGMVRDRLRLSADGEAVVGDVDLVPHQVHELMAAGGYPQRSAELWVDKELIPGKRFPLAFRGGAWLGAEAPALKNLNELRALYNAEPQARALADLEPDEVTVMADGQKLPDDQAADAASNAVEGHGPVTGTHSHPHAGYGAAGHDAHEHTHSNDNNHEPGASHSHAGMDDGSDSQGDQPDDIASDALADNGKTSDADKAKAAQKARSSRYNIAVKDNNSNVTKPSRWSDVPDSQWGDPVNYRYPMGDECLGGETLITLAPGGKPISIRDLCGREALIWTYDSAAEQIRLGLATNVHRTMRDVPVLRVALDNGQAIVCTPNHPFMLRDGTYLRADRLVVGCQLMPTSGIGYNVVDARTEPELVPAQEGRDERGRTRSAAPGQDAVHAGMAIPPGFCREAAGLRRGLSSETAVWDELRECQSLAADRSGSRASTLGSGEATRSRPGAYEGPGPRLQVEQHRQGTPAGPRGRGSPAAQRPRRSAPPQRGLRSQEADETDRTGWSPGPGGLRDLRLGPVPDRLGSLPPDEQLSRLDLRPLQPRPGDGLRLAGDSLSAGGIRVASLEPAGRADTYDLTVEGTHNFALAAGVFVHNSHANNAAGRFAQNSGENGGDYSSAEEKIVGGRISRRQKALGVKSAQTSNQAAADFTDDEVRAAVQDALDDAYPQAYDAMGMPVPPDGDGPAACICDLNRIQGLVWTHDQAHDGFFQIPFSLDDNTGDATLGDPAPARRTYELVPASTSMADEPEEDDMATLSDDELRSMFHIAPEADLKTEVYKHALTMLADDGLRTQVADLTLKDARRDAGEAIAQLKAEGKIAGPREAVDHQVEVLTDLYLKDHDTFVAVTDSMGKVVDYAVHGLGDDPNGGGGSEPRRAYQPAGPQAQSDLRKAQQGLGISDEQMAAYETSTFDQRHRAAREAMKNRPEMNPRGRDLGLRLHS